MLMYKDVNKYYDFYYDDDKYLKEEIKYQKLIEKITGYKVYLNPITKLQLIKTPDYWIKDTNELWDLKNLNGNVENLIDNVVNNAKVRLII